MENPPLTQAPQSSPDSPFADDTAPHPLEAILPQMMELAKTAVDNGSRQATAIDRLASAIERLAIAIAMEDSNTTETESPAPLPPEAVAFLKDQAAPQPPVESTPVVFNNPPLFVAH